MLRASSVLLCRWGGRLNGCEDWGDWDSAKHLAEWAREVRYGVLMEMFEEVKRRGGGLGVSSYNTMVRAAGKRGMGERWVDEMKARGVPTNDVTYDCLMRGYATRGDVEAVRKLWLEMEEQNITLTPRFYNIAVRAHAAAGDEAGAFDVFSDVTDADPHLWGSLILACRSHATTDETYAKSPKDHVTTSFYVSALAEQGRLGLARDLIAGLIKAQHRIPSSIWTSYLAALGGEGRVDEILSYLRNPGVPTPTLKAVYTSLKTPEAKQHFVSNIPDPSQKRALNWIHGNTWVMKPANYTPLTEDLPSPRTEDPGCRPRAAFVRPKKVPDIPYL